MLYSGEIDEFVEKELLPDAAETMNALSEAEKTAVSLLLKAYIGFLSEEATVDEQSFPMVKELLSYTQGSKEDGEKDAIDYSDGRYGQQNPQTSRILQQLSTLSTDAGG